MSKIIFNEHERRVLESNPNVSSVSDRAIQYTSEFKIQAVKENLDGKGPAQIFIEAGFDLEMIELRKHKVHLTAGELHIKYTEKQAFRRTSRKRKYGSSKF